jgi:hypothetical protein
MLKNWCFGYFWIILGACFKKILSFDKSFLRKRFFLDFPFCQKKFVAGKKVLILRFEGRSCGI